MKAAAFVSCICIKKLGNSEGRFKSHSVEAFNFTPFGQPSQSQFSVAWNKTFFLLEAHAVLITLSIREIHTIQICISKAGFE